ncbi:hypothetical protein [Halobacillus litoralis]|uniref:hypothetical protein n=1 Tax=Halobacillus litoralis TaxID=45668 RepID=UPI001CFEDE77|nr:hypothetical protein [Halobacillus litoralis]
MTTAIIISLVSLFVAILALLVNVSKFFIEIHDRKQKRIEGTKANITVEREDSSKSKYLIFKNEGSTAHIHEVKINGVKWEDTGIFLENELPSLLSGGQVRKVQYFASKTSKIAPPFGLEIIYEDDYSRKYLSTKNKVAIQA